MRNPCDWIKFHGREGITRLVRHPYYWLKHYPERRRYARAHRAETVDDRDFDRRYGVDTANRAALTNLNIPFESWKHGVRYQGVHEATFDEALATVQCDYERATFIDLGSGKGKALMLASRLPFAKLIGVEFAPDLIAAAKTNIAQFLEVTGGRPHEVEFVCADATQFAFPETPLVVFLFNPFDETILRPVVANLEASIARAPRAVWVVYINARFRALIDAAPSLQLAAESERLCVWRTPS